MDNTLMKVTQLPVIEEHLRSRKEQTEQRVAEAMSLVCTDETLTSVKNIRAEMNREFADAETQRKAIKAAIMEKYDSFEAVYRECIADPYKRADADLKAKIDATESEIKSRCEEMLLGYFIGPFGALLSSGIFTSILQNYFTDVLKLDLGFLTTLQLVSTVLIVASNLIVGQLIEHTKALAGKARPWILLSALTRRQCADVYRAV